MLKKKTEEPVPEAQPTSEFTISLLITGVNTSTCAAYLVSKPAFVMGKAPTCDGVLAFSDEISREHARIDWQNGAYSLTDLGSINGTFLNGKRLPPRAPFPLHPGDRIGLSTYLFSVNVLKR